MAIVICIFIFLFIFLAAYVVLLQMQLRGINRQLARRLTNKTRQPVNLELLNRELNKLAANINKCLKAEEMLRLEKIRKEKRFRELIANISHDLRTPLTAIKGYQQLLEKGGLTDEQREKLLIAGKHANELGDLIERFFEYAHLISTEPEIAMERINLTNLVAECIVDFIPILEEKNKRIYFEETAPVFIQADREMLVRIIKNLIRNCAVYADGNIDVQILFEQKAVMLFRNPVKNAAELDVTKLFERYYTADNARGKGTGLGLSIVKLLTEQQGGNASASIKDGIIEVCVELPLYH